MFSSWAGADFAFFSFSLGWQAWQNHCGYQAVRHLSNARFFPLLRRVFPAPYQTLDVSPLSIYPNHPKSISLVTSDCVDCLQHSNIEINAKVQTLQKLKDRSEKGIDCLIFQGAFQRVCEFSCFKVRPGPSPSVKSWQRQVRVGFWGKPVWGLPDLFSR